MDGKADTIELKGMRFFGFHGVLPEERERGQEFVVDLEIELPRGAALDDDIDSTVNYAEVYTEVRRLVERARFSLLETLADRIAGTVLELFPAVGVRVKVKKPEAPISGLLEWAAVTVERYRAAVEDKEWVEVFLALGSNLGDRQANLWQALGRLSAHPLIRLLQVSSFYETRPVGGVEQGNFINAAARLAIMLKPLELLDLIREIESGMGRERTVKWGPRTIDLDILLYGKQSIELESLVVPHPEMYKRDFVLAPLAEIAPDQILPNGKTAAEIMKDLYKMGINLLSKFPGHVTIYSR
ncbi:MAG: 2-amino-4-hydroxy-6-hydroxymethyldihydropteridine diphosphokinase [Firmicutes bacterium]|nr:2-amino-4-hydroxy-6-hydroxymethyldihydropteridine diphosphokinase [Bacillota bacterium]